MSSHTIMIVKMVSHAFHAPRWWTGSGRILGTTSSPIKLENAMNYFCNSAFSSGAATPRPRRGERKQPRARPLMAAYSPPPARFERRERGRGVHPLQRNPRPGATRTSPGRQPPAQVAAFPHAQGGGSSETIRTRTGVESWRRAEERPTERVEDSDSDFHGARQPRRRSTAGGEG